MVEKSKRAKKNKHESPTLLPAVCHHTMTVLSLVSLRSRQLHQDESQLEHGLYIPRYVAFQADGDSQSGRMMPLSESHGKVCPSSRLCGRVLW